jgi:ammonia channel protein AmtB
MSSARTLAAHAKHAAHMWMGFWLVKLPPVRLAAAWLISSSDDMLAYHTRAGGLSGFKSVLSTAIQTMAIASLISICWLMFGYSLAFGPGRANEFIGGSEKFWFMGSGSGDLRAVHAFLHFFFHPPSRQKS